MRESSTVIVPFALKDRWIITVESERHFVKMRRRTRWYAVARRKGYEDRRHWCASRADALGIAEHMRDAFERWAFAEQCQAMLDRLPPIRRARAIEKLRALTETKEPVAVDRYPRPVDR